MRFLSAGPQPLPFLSYGKSDARVTFYYLL